MTREYILTHTPFQIAVEHTHTEIRNELDSMHSKDAWLVETAVGSFHWTRWMSTVCADMIHDCRDCLTHWYDEDYGRYAEDFAVACALASAAYIAEHVVVK